MATHSCSCLENPRDGGAWWAAVFGVTQNRTRLKRLSSSSRHDLKYMGGDGKDGRAVCWLYGNTALFYIKDLSICGFWYLREGKFLEPILHK